MKTPEEILKEKFGTAYKHLNVEQICECIETYHNQFHPTPTEAEINEAANDAMLCADLPFDGENDFIMGFKECFTWLQNYQTPALGITDTRPDQTQGRDKPVDNDNQYQDWLKNTKEQAAEKYADSVFIQLSPSNPNKAAITNSARIDFSAGYEFCADKLAYQPNPAIAVIEALEAARAELYQFVPITDASVLHKLTEAINSLKQIKP